MLVCVKKKNISAVSIFLVSYTIILRSVGESFSLCYYVTMISIKIDSFQNLVEANLDILNFYMLACLSNSRYKMLPKCLPPLI